MKFITILVCKLLAFLGRLLRRGSSLPGSVALKLCPDILQRITLPECVIAVSGSNGKSSTVEMIASILTENGKKVVWNKEGSNLIDGVTTMLLRNASFSGKVKGDIVVMESDERYARHTFKYIKPNYFVITNLYRDQLSRNVHPFWIYDILKDAVDMIPDATLLLNADDPIVSKFGYGRENVLYFGMDKNRHSTEKSDTVSNDCDYCPICKSPLSYDFFHYAHLGNYHCDKCGYATPSADFRIDGLDLDCGEVSICGEKISLAFKSRYNVYNLCAAFSACTIAGIDKKDCAKSLNGFIMRNGRVLRFKAGENEGTLIISKHENATSYNQTIEYLTRESEPFTVAFIVDAISKRYFTTETVWFYDIFFERLKDSKAEKILLCGSYAYDLATRLEITGIEEERIKVIPDLDVMVSEMSKPTEHNLFVTTCFTDKDKLFNRVTLINPIINK